jgi:actin beta/gamma 1
VVDTGHDRTHVVTIYEGYALPHSIQRVEVGGKDVTEEMSRVLQQRGYSFTTPAELEIVRGMKEKHAYICETGAQYDDETKEKDEDVVVGRGRERMAAEILFRPQTRTRIDGTPDGLQPPPGLDTLVSRCILLCDVDVRLDFTQNIVLCGGNSIKGMGARLQHDLGGLFTWPCRVIASPEYSVWKGGFILASLETFQQMWISRSFNQQGRTYGGRAYDEDGPQVIHQCT